MGAQRGVRRDEGEVEADERDARTCLCVIHGTSLGSQRQVNSSLLVRRGSSLAPLPGMKGRNNVSLRRFRIHITVLTKKVLL